EPTPRDICAIYNALKPILDRIVPMLRKLPVFGHRIADAIEALRRALDVYCAMGAGGGPRAESLSSDDQRFLEALSAFEFPGTAGSRAEALDLCTTYRKVKPILEPLIPFLALIPTYGTGIAAGLTVLMAALDKLCPATVVA